MSFTVDVPGISGSGGTAMIPQPTDEPGTRPVCRLRVDFGAEVPSRLYSLLFEPGDFVMMRLTLQGIKQRAERTTAADLAALGTTAADR